MHVGLLRWSGIHHGLGGLLVDIHLRERRHDLWRSKDPPDYEQDETEKD
jgi:hypothetical protein